MTPDIYDAPDGLHFAALFALPEDVAIAVERGLIVQLARILVVPVEEAAE